MERNLQDGIYVMQNSSVSLGIGTGSGIFDLPESSGSHNCGAGIRCARNSSVDSRLGSLQGSKGARELDTSFDGLGPAT